MMEIVPVTVRLKLEFFKTSPLKLIYSVHYIFVLAVEGEVLRYMRSSSIWTSKSPRERILENLTCLDFHAKLTFKAVVALLERTQYGTLGPRLKLRRIIARGEEAARLAIVLVPGQYVMLHDGTVCLYAGAFSDAEGTVRAMVLNMEQYDRKRGRRNIARVCIHPGAKLPWLARCPAEQIRAVNANRIFYRVFVVPALFVTPQGEISHLGYLLVHGIFNWDLRTKKKDRPFKKRSN
jgi:hypothetical protein